jgi:hypothetical protein
MKFGIHKHCFMDCNKKPVAKILIRVRYFSNREHMQEFTIELCKTHFNMLPDILIDICEPPPNSGFELTGIDYRIINSMSTYDVV